MNIVSHLKMLDGLTKEDWSDPLSVIHNDVFHPYHVYIIAFFL